MSFLARTGRSIRSNENARKEYADDLQQRPLPLARPLRSLPRRSDDRPRRDDRERRAAVDPRRSRLLADVARLGGELLPADVRRLPAPGRPAGRSLRPPAVVPF